MILKELMLYQNTCLCTEWGYLKLPASQRAQTFAIYLICM